MILSPKSSGHPSFRLMLLQDVAMLRLTGQTLETRPLLPVPQRRYRLCLILGDKQLCLNFLINFNAMKTSNMIGTPNPLRLSVYVVPPKFRHMLRLTGKAKLGITLNTGSQNICGMCNMRRIGGLRMCRFILRSSNPSSPLTLIYGPPTDMFFGVCTVMMTG